MSDEKTHSRFDRLLDAMAHGQSPNEQKKTSSGQASGAAPDACSSDTRTRPDTSEDASEKPKRGSRTSRA